VVRTSDGYFLGLHRILPRDKSKDNKRPTVLLWHGFMMNSEIFVCRPERTANLAFWLVDLGFDVWLGNCRGNKYSFKHQSRSALNSDFWDFSMDEIALIDIPSTVDYVLAQTEKSSLTYIGFSQGTATAFAALSVNLELNKKINCFIGLAPAMAPFGLMNRFINSIVKASPSIIYLLFGRRAAISMVYFWQEVIPTPLFVKFIDYCMYFLFNWHSRNIDYKSKLSCYLHLYSTTSVKVLVHWFQIIRNLKLQFYDDIPNIRPSTSSRTHHIHSYPTKQITTKVVLFHGGSDTLSDNTLLIESLPELPFHKDIPHYEHLDFLWAKDIECEIYPDLMDQLKQLYPDSKIGLEYHYE
jgi:lysosomal acid lipase/cholesteryl ester hydrolase